MLHDWIRQRREDAGLRQSDVADRLGRTQAHVSRIEAGQIRITVELLQQLATVLGFDLTEAIQQPAEEAA